MKWGFFFPPYYLKFWPPGPRGLLTTFEIQDKKVMHKENHSPPISVLFGDELCGRRGESVWTWGGPSWENPAGRGQGGVENCLTCEVMVLVAGCLLCGFGGQCFGLEKSHGWISVVKCVLMNEIRWELWRVVFSVQGAMVDVEMQGKARAPGTQGMRWGRGGFSA